MDIQTLIRAHHHLTQQQKRVISVIAVIICAILVIVGCNSIIHKKIVIDPLMIRRRGQIIIPEHSPLRDQIVLQKVQESKCPHMISFPAIIEADPTRTINILPPLAGRLTELKVKLGETVKKNQLLAVISAPELAQANADYDKATQALQLAKDTLDRAQKSYQIGATPLKDLHDIETTFARAQSDFMQTSARLKTLGNNAFSQLNIHAPISGQIIALNYGEGSYINDTTAALFTLSNIKSVLVTAFIPENLVGVVLNGQNASIVTLAYPNEVFHSHVSFVNSMIESDSRRNKTRIVLKNPLKKLQPNMFATVNIAVKQPKQIAIPISAILMNNDSTSVYIETSPWTFVRREVQLGSEDGDHIHVQSGLNIGERIVVSGGVFIND